jgi:hypothetical protein
LGGWVYNSEHNPDETRIWWNGIGFDPIRRFQMADSGRRRYFTILNALGWPVRGD